MEMVGMEIGGWEMRGDIGGIGGIGGIGKGRRNVRAGSVEPL